MSHNWLHSKVLREKNEMSGFVGGLVSGWGSE